MIPAYKVVLFGSLSASMYMMGRLVLVSDVPRPRPAATAADSPRDTRRGSARTRAKIPEEAMYKQTAYRAAAIHPVSFVAHMQCRRAECECECECECTCECECRATAMTAATSPPFSPSPRHMSLASNQQSDTAGWGSSELCPSPCVLAQPEPSAPRCFYGGARCRTANLSQLQPVHCLWREPAH